ncbi:excinuclease ABC subunit UvrB [candidate division KSB1 bacterium]|nr:excinuclease ABC subunit UvrB [candidate division KSB1 bacterium]
MMDKFLLKTHFTPKGDQEKAIQELSEGFQRGDKFQTLLGVTGSGKTFTMANVIANLGRPTLIISHNKTLAAQLYGEFKTFFPNNAVGFFISYFDYYQPEAYMVTTDTYIEKDSSVNDDIDRLRLKATSALLEREDVIIVASVSCIYGLGSPDEYKNLMLYLERGQNIERDAILRKLVDIHYTRNDFDFHRGTFRVRGDVIEIFPAYDEIPIRIELFGDEVDSIYNVNQLTGEIISDMPRLALYPAKHYVTSQPRMEKAIESIRLELQERLTELRTQNKLLEAQRLEMRTNYDIEMMEELGYCSGIENYSRHLTDRQAGERPFTLFNFFPKDLLTIIDESHATVPQIGAMYSGDRSRKEVLVEHGFRLPSALDNRPLTFEEFESVVDKVLFVSATPAEFELEKSKGVVVEQIIRPTGLIDPEIEIRPTKGQIDDLIVETKERAENKERTLITTLTKRMAEDLTDYLADSGVRVRYLHSEINALDRVQILRDLRLAEFDVLVGINLLREGLDLPEVALVAILDADKEGFLRSERSLLQTAGRAARNVNGKVIFYADVITDSMKKVIDETNRRRAIQHQNNVDNNLTPTTIYKSIDDVMETTRVADAKTVKWKKASSIRLPRENMAIEETLEFLEKEMHTAAVKLEFELAAEIRDEIEKHKSKYTSRK